MTLLAQFHFNWAEVIILSRYIYQCTHQQAPWLIAIPVHHEVCQHLFRGIHIHNMDPCWESILQEWPQAILNAVPSGFQVACKHLNMQLYTWRLPSCKGSCESRIIDYIFLKAYTMSLPIFLVTWNSLVLLFFLSFFHLWRSAWLLFSCIWKCMKLGRWNAGTNWIRVWLTCFTLGYYFAFELMVALSVIRSYGKRKNYARSGHRPILFSIFVTQWQLEMLTNQHCRSTVSSHHFSEISI